MEQYRNYLLSEEKSRLTIDKYIRDVEKYLRWSGGEISKERVLAYKEALLGNYAVASVNSMLSSVNSYLEYIDRPECKVKTVKHQREIFTRPERELTKREYGRLLKAAESKPRLKLLMQTICATGIRVSELRFITVSAARTGRAQVRCKGKSRAVIIPKDLSRLLLRYAAKHGIREGSVFVTKNGKPLDRSNIWSEMKRLCKLAGVLASKVFPHNLRHLFARTYYTIQKDIVRLADILGHSSVNTTRIYTTESGDVHRRQLEKMGLLFIT